MMDNERKYVTIDGRDVTLEQLQRQTASCISWFNRPAYYGTIAEVSSKRRTFKIDGDNPYQE